MAFTGWFGAGAAWRLWAVVVASAAGVGASGCSVERVD